MEEQSLTQSISQLLGQAPPPIRAFVLNELPETVNRLMGRHGIHVDQAGVLEAELLLMLVGQSRPTEFVKALEDAGIDKEKVRAIANDVNREVFVRLRQEERKQAAQVPSRASSPITQVATAEKSLAATTSSDRPREAKTVPPPPNLPGQIPAPPPTPRPAPPPPPRIEVPTPPPAPAVQPEPAPAPKPPVQDQNTRIIHTMARDMQALKSGEDPFRVAHPAPPAWAAAPQSAPVAPPPPPVAPVAKPEPVPPQAPVPPAPQAPPPAPATNEPLRAHLKQYGVDPYREPIE